MKPFDRTVQNLVGLDRLVSYNWGDYNIRLKLNQDFATIWSSIYLLYLESPRRSYSSRAIEPIPSNRIFSSEMQPIAYFYIDTTKPFSSDDVCNALMT